MSQVVLYLLLLLCVSSKCVLRERLHTYVLYNSILVFQKLILGCDHGAQDFVPVVMSVVAFIIDRDCIDGTYDDVMTPHLFALESLTISTPPSSNKALLAMGVTNRFAPSTMSGLHGSPVFSSKNAL